MKKEYYFYNCCLEGRQLRLGESGFLAAKEVVQAICDADFRNNGSYLKDPNAQADYYHEYIKRPKDGLYLMRAVKIANHASLDILIDTRLFPNFVLIEKNNNMPQMHIEVMKAFERWLNHAANQYGWIATLKENQLNVIHDVDLFKSAMAFAEDTDVPDFSSFINYEERIEEVLETLHLMIDKKVKARPIMRIITAAIDSGIIDKPDYLSLIQEFHKESIMSLSAYKLYTKKECHPLKQDKIYLEYLDKFLRLKDRWLDEFGRN